MAFLKERRKGVHSYFEAAESVRNGDSVQHRFLKKFRGLRQANEYAQAHGLRRIERAALLDDETRKLLEKKLAELNALRPLPAQSVQSLRKKLEVEMTYNSNAIEGNRLSLKETFLVLEKGITIGGKTVREHLEATNHRDALELLETIAAAKRPITEKDVLGLHAVILDKIMPDDAGVYRNCQVFITGTEHTPPSYRQVPELMKQVVEELNSKAKGADALESAAKLHHLFVWIHPFVDGNGRLARLLTNLRLIRAGFPPVVLQRKIRKTYYAALEEADEGDLAPLCRIIARDELHALDLWLSAAR